MLDITKSEFYKIRKSRITLITALILMGIAAIEMVVFLYAKFSDGFWSEVMAGTKGVDIYTGFATGSLYLIFIALFVGGIISNEYTNRTIRQVVSRGKSRLQIAAGQFIALATSMTIMTIVPAMLSALVASLCWEFGEVSFKRFLLVVFGQIIMIWSYAAITMLIAHLTRSGGLSIGINVIFLMAGSTVSMLLYALTGKEWYNTYWLTNMQSFAMDYTLSVAKQGKFIVILFVIGVVCLALGLTRFKIKDVD